MFFANISLPLTALTLNSLTSTEKFSDAHFPTFRFLPPIVYHAQTVNRI